MLAEAPDQVGVTVGNWAVQVTIALLAVKTVLDILNDSFGVRIPWVSQAKRRHHDIATADLLRKIGLSEFAARIEQAVSYKAGNADVTGVESIRSVVRQYTTNNEAHLQSGVIDKHEHKLLIRLDRAVSSIPAMRSLITALLSLIDERGRTIMTKGGEFVFDKVVVIKEGNPALGILVATSLGKPFALVTVSNASAVGASVDGCINANERVIIITDVIVTSRLVASVAQHVESLGALVKHCVVVVERTDLVPNPSVVLREHYGVHAHACMRINDRQLAKLMQVN